MKAVACLVVLGGLLVCTHLRSDSSSPGTHSGRVVSYLVGASASPERWNPDPPLDPTPYDWRIYDPETDRDVSFVHLPGSPTRIRWDAAFRFVEYKVGSVVFRAPWETGAMPVFLMRLPVDSTICDFWLDERDTSWNYTSDRNLGSLLRHGSTFQISSAELWRSQDRGAHWNLVTRDSCWEVGCGCVAAHRPQRGMGSPIALETLQDSMRIEHHPYRTLKAVEFDSGENALVSVPVVGVPGARLELMEGFGDSDHAILPIVYVNEQRGIRRTICKEDTTMDFNQFGFQQEGDYLLTAGEFLGGNAVVTDLRTGRTRFRAPSRARWSVWVPRPR